jgi:hypothetical protein
MTALPPVLSPSSILPPRTVLAHLFGAVLKMLFVQLINLKLYCIFISLLRMLYASIQGSSDGNREGGEIAGEPEQVL